MGELAVLAPTLAAAENAASYTWASPRPWLPVPVPPSASPRSWLPVPVLASVSPRPRLPVPVSAVAELRWRPGLRVLAEENGAVAPMSERLCLPVPVSASVSPRPWLPVPASAAPSPRWPPGLREVAAEIGASASVSRTVSRTAAPCCGGGDEGGSRLWLAALLPTTPERLQIAGAGDSGWRVGLGTDARMTSIPLLFASPRPLNFPP